jgi:hypothetical protein
MVFDGHVASRDFRSMEVVCLDEGISTKLREVLLTTTSRCFLLSGYKV